MYMYHIYYYMNMYIQPNLVILNSRVDIDSLSCYLRFSFLRLECYMNSLKLNQLNQHSAHCSTH